MAQDNEGAIDARKKTLRKEARARLKAFCADSSECERQSELLCKKILCSALYESARALLAFMPLKTEPSPLALLRDALGRGKIAAVPKIISGGRMEFFVLNPALPIEAQCSPCAYGILEPKPGLRIFEPESAGDSVRQDALVLVPGLLFGRDGTRLGRGGGYYDRYLRRLLDCGFTDNFVPFAFDFQLENSVPTGGHDVTLRIP